MSIPISQHQHQQVNYHYSDVNGSSSRKLQQSQSQTQQRSQMQLQQLSSYASVVERSASAHLYAQKLNNVASMCIEVGHYDKAIASLGKALRLSELHIVDQLLDRSQACICNDCSLDGCITFSESESNNNKKNPSNLFDLCNQNKNNKRNNIQNMMFVDDEYDQEEEGGNEQTTSTSASTSPMNSRSIYSRPIRIPPRSISEGHNMGSTLFLNITFNLALAHHLKAVSLVSSSSSTSTATASSSSVASESLIANTLQLYELTNNWQHHFSSEEEDHEDENESDDDSIMTMETTYDEEDEETPSRSATGAAAGAGAATATATTASPMNRVNMNSTYCSSVRFNMILCTNLSHLHRLMKNDALSQQWLEQLLSTVMFVIDQNKNQIKQEPQHHVTHVTTNTSATDTDNDVDFEYGDDENDDHHQQQSQSQLHVQHVLPSSSSSRFIDVQGFVQNTTSLILQDHCADAA